MKGYWLEQAGYRLRQPRPQGVHRFAFPGGGAAIIGQEQQAGLDDVDFFTVRLAGGDMFWLLLSLPECQLRTAPMLHPQSSGKRSRQDLARLVEAHREPF